LNARFVADVQDTLRHQCLPPCDEGWLTRPDTPWQRCLLVPVSEDEVVIFSALDDKEIY
jgi:hypothetical protein